jgi:hypothetical protein
MAKCNFCNQEMTTADGCAPALTAGAVRIPFGKETRYAGLKKRGIRLPMANDAGRCHDCNVKAGKFHHPGCDVEECAKCGQQRIGCDCVGGSI